MASVIINYCSNERMFIDVLLDECKKFSDDIVVSYGSHLYDGSLEDFEHIDECRAKHPSVTFVKYDVDVKLPVSKRKGVQVRPTAYWHNLARWTAVNCLKSNNQWVFVIDADEIPEGEMIREWLNEVASVLNPDVCYKQSCYWYFKHPTNRAVQLEDSVLLMHRSYLTENNIFGDLERDYLIHSSGCRLLRHTRDGHGNVMWHHFSFVRDIDGLRHKVKNWGHANDSFKNLNVDNFIGYIYRNDDVNDIVHSYTYEKVANRFNIQVKNM